MYTGLDVVKEVKCAERGIFQQIVEYRSNRLEIRNAVTNESFCKMQSLI